MYKRKHTVLSVRIALPIFLASLVSNVVAVPLGSELNSTISEHPIILVVSYDGFRHDYLNSVNTPILHGLKSAGVSVPYMVPVFPTKTFPNHQSIATGLYAESHGIVDNTFFDPAYNKTLSGFSDDPGFWNYHKDVMPIWIWNEMAGEGRVSGCLMWPGSSQPYGENNDTLPTYYRDYDGSVPWESRVDTVISWITDDTKPANLVFLYFDEPDTHGHAFGPNYEETLAEVINADNRTDYLVKKLTEAGIFDKVNLIMLSDHGMQEVTQERIINISALIDPTLLKAKYGGTPLLQLIPEEGQGDALYDALERNMSLGYTVWKKEELASNFRYNDSRRILDYIVVADPGYAFEDFDATIKYYNERYNLTASPTREYGVHGYSNEAVGMRPYFIAHGPAFRKGFEFQPIRNIDLVPLISTVLGIPTPSNNGSLDAVSGMLNSNLKETETGGNTGVAPKIQSACMLLAIPLFILTLL